MKNFRAERCWRAPAYALASNWLDVDGGHGPAWQSEPRSGPGLCWCCPSDDGRRAELPGFDPYFARWIEQLRERQKSPSTVSTYAQALPPCTATLRSIVGTDVTVRTISPLKPALFEQMQQRMYEEGAKGRTIELRMAALRSFGSFLLQHEYARCYGFRRCLRRNGTRGKGACGSRCNCERADEHGESALCASGALYSRRLGWVNWKRRPLTDP